jgi:hypothetical protein
MYTKKDFQVGQKIYTIKKVNGNSLISALEITKVGNKYLQTGNGRGRKFFIEDLKEVKDFGRISHAYFSEEEIHVILEKNDLINEISKKFYHLNFNKYNYSLDQLRKIKRILNE